jgi:hypothetical protein
MKHPEKEVITKMRRKKARKYLRMLFNIAFFQKTGQELGFASG